jgi:hypothetical protein
LLTCFCGSAQILEGNKYLKKDYKEYKKSVDSINEILKWKEVRDGLYIDKNGVLGFKGTEVAKDIRITIYQINFQDKVNTPISRVVDAATFKKVDGNNSGAYYKDKNRIYHAFPTSGGPNFYAVWTDYASFKIVNDCYAKDKNHVYDMRNGLQEDIDVKTFKVLEIDNRCYAKDKNGYYEGTFKLTDEQLKDPEIQRAIKKLDKL